MEIREIRIDQFGCWQDIAITGLRSGLNVIHLDDGGQPVEFSRFLNNVLYGFEGNPKSSSGGAIVFSDGDDTLSVDRQQAPSAPDRLRVKHNGRKITDDRWLQMAQSATPEPIASRFFLPNGETNTSGDWQWLTKQDDLLKILLQDDSSVKTSKRMTVGGDPDLIEQKENELETLRRKHSSLAEEVTELEASLRNLPSEQESSTPAISLADIDEELRVISLQIGPYESALELNGQWRELQGLRNEPEADVDAGLLRRALRQFKQAEDDKQPHRETLARTGKPRRIKKREPRPYVSQAKRLLKQRDWVLNRLAEAESLAADNLATDNLAFSQDTFGSVPNDLSRAVELYRRAKRENARAAAELEIFVENGQAESSDFSIDLLAQKEISFESPLAIAPPEEQLRELKRRRVWLHRDHHHLLNHYSVTSQIRLWITILFVLSVLTLFGTLIVVSHWWQLVMAALGLCGIVAAGSLKTTLERRASKRIGRSESRLSNIDREIDLLVEEMNDEAETAKEQFYARELASLRARVELAARSLQSAEVAYRDQLLANGITEMMNPEDALAWAAKVPFGPDAYGNANHTAGFPDELAASSSNELENDRELRAWAKQARKVVRQAHPNSPSKSPRDLLHELELIETDRHVDDDDSQTSFVEDEAKFAQDELRRLEKFQRSVLRKVGFGDAYDLEAAVETATEHQKEKKRRKRLERDFSTALESIDDAEEVIELLEVHDEIDLQQRLEQLREHRAELKDLRLEHRPPKLQTMNSETQREQLASQLFQKNQRLVDLQSSMKAVELEIKTLCEQTVHETIQTPKSNIPWLLNPLTKQQFNHIEFSDDPEVGFIARRNGSNQPAVQLQGDSQLGELSWLAMQLRLGMINQRLNNGNVLPIVCLADSLLPSQHPDTPHRPSLEAILRVLEVAADRGLQIFLLAAKPQTAAKLKKAGASVVRIGLEREVMAA